MMFHKDGTQPEGDDWIFVFGSNLAGIHGAGAARAAADYWGAELGEGLGLTGSAWAIPTKDKQIRTLSLAKIKVYVEHFLAYAKLAQHKHPERKFFVTRVGCGLAGYTDAEIAPLFEGAPPNCSFAEQWRKYLVK